MEAERTNNVLIVVGNRSTGKTDFIKSIVRSSSQEKTLIVDTFDNPVWRNMKTWDDPNGENTPIHSIAPEHLLSWKKGTYLMYDSDTDYLMDHVQRNLSNALMVLEDATKYVGSKLTKDQKKFVIDSKQKNLDLIFVFHSLTDVPRDLIRISDYVTLCKTGEEWNATLQNKFHKVKAAFDHVAKSKNQYEKITVQISG